MKTTNRLQEIRDAMKNSFHERSDLIDGMITALVAKEMLFLIGPPGTAKSAVCEALCNAIGGDYFSWLISKFTTPEELFGPYSFKALDQDKYQRVTDKKLPEANVAFLDEIFKGSSAILNTLLPIINERKFYNGTKPSKIPLQVLFGASNEIPEAQELAALYDRFALRYQVNRLMNNSSASSLFKNGGVNPKIPNITLKELEAEQTKAEALQISDAIVKLLVELRNAVEKEGIYVSDRKWVQSTRILKAYAHLNGHKEVEAEDLDILENVLWTNPEQIKVIKRLVQKVSNPLGDQIIKICDAIQDISNRIGAMSNVEAIEAQKKIKDSIKKLEALGDAGKNPKLKQALKLARDTNLIILKEKLGME